MHTDAATALVEIFPFLLHNSSQFHTFILFGYRQGRKKNFPDDIDLRENTTKKKDPKKISPQIFPIIKIFLFLLGGWGDFTNFHT